MIAIICIDKPISLSSLILLSYAAIAPIMHYIKKILNIAPHIIIHDLEDTGKTILLEMVGLGFPKVRGKKEQYYKGLKLVY